MKPLPDHTKLRYEECYAKILLERHFSKFSGGLVIQDKPDLYCETNDIGIEVTDIMDSNKKEGLSLWCKIPYMSNAEKEKSIERLEQLGVIYQGGVQGWPPINYNKGLESKPYLDFYDALDKKLKKLNSGKYKVYKENDLLVFSELMFINFDEYRIYDRINEIIKKYKIKFNELFLIRWSKVTIYNFDNQNYIREIFYSDDYDIAMNARKMVEDAENNEQT